MIKRRLIWVMYITVCSGLPCRAVPLLCPCLKRCAPPVGRSGALAGTGRCERDPDGLRWRSEALRLPEIPARNPGDQHQPKARWAADIWSRARLCQSACVRVFPVPDYESTAHSFLQTTVVETDISYRTDPTDFTKAYSRTGSVHCAAKAKKILFTRQLMWNAKKGVCIIGLQFRLSIVFQFFLH